MVPVVTHRGHEGDVSPVVCSSDGKSIASREAYPGAMVQAGAVILDTGRYSRLDKTTTRPWNSIATFFPK